MEQESQTSSSGLGSLADRSLHFSQLSSLQDHSLHQLRDHVKQVMIPMLIKTFQYELDLFSKEGSEEKERSILEMSKQLQELDRELYILEQWIATCRNQIAKALHSSSHEGDKEHVKPLQERLLPKEQEKKESWWKGVLHALMGIKKEL